ncbi:MAG: hypothetical protein C4K47_06615 [Candidatus Thorarchaeota archaeon]|nr:MAG: hypothetical protein C4K47_06615 [Candidatus Thorarchaeota archaeon]
MSTVIGDEWKSLFENNPGFQAFAVCKDGVIIWQTTNWDLVNEAKELAQAPDAAAQSVQVNKVKYSRVASSQESYIGTSGGDEGHFLMTLVQGKTWLMALVAPESLPELAIIDLSRSAIRLIDKV